MIEKAEEDMDQHKVKSMAECMSIENNWNIPGMINETFETKLRSQMSIEEQFEFSIDKIDGFNGAAVGSGFAA